MVFSMEMLAGKCKKEWDERIARYEDLNKKGANKVKKEVGEYFEEEDKSNSITLSDIQVKDPPQKKNSSEIFLKIRKKELRIMRTVFFIIPHVLRKLS